MPTLHIRGVPSELMGRLRASAREADAPIDQHALDLLERGLDARAHAAERGRRRAAVLSPERRRDIARQAALARHRKE